MGTLTPGASYIYERVDDVVYAREVGAIERREIGRDYTSPSIEKLQEDKLWGEIRRAAKTNITLQTALDECIMIYKLSKDYTDGI
jgi:hypothetical protein